MERTLGLTLSALDFVHVCVVAQPKSASAGAAVLKFRSSVENLAKDADQDSAHYALTLDLLNNLTRTIGTVLQLSPKIQFNAPGCAFEDESF
jgi:hypothetical protein